MIKTKTQSQRANGSSLPFAKIPCASILMILGTALAVNAAQGPQPSICIRSCWGARNGACTTTMSSLTRAIIHHTAGTGDFTTDYETAKSRMRGIQNLHMDGNGWCDIAYHFLVDAGGHIFEGRKNSMTSLIKGSHAGCGNVNSFGFTFLGYFHPPYNQSPPVAMRNSMYDVIAWRMPSGWSPYGGRTSYPGSLYGTAAPIDTHRWVGAATGGGCGSTACPGDVIINNYITDNFSGGEMRDGVNCRKNGTCGGVPKAKVCDFDGDGKTDRAVWRQSTSDWYVYGLPTVAWGGGGDIDVPGDYNGDGKTDYAVFRASANQWIIHGQPTVSWGQPGDIPVPGDYNGDGKTDCAVFRPSTGQWIVVGASTVVYGGGSDIPVPGDYNGDGKTDRAIWRPSNGEWHVQVSGIGVVVYGASTDIPVPGDYDGNGTTDRAVWRPSTGGWHVQVPGINVITFGGSGDRPVPGDYNGDGKIDRAVFRPSTSEWFVQVSGIQTVQWGTGTDRILALPYAIRRVYFP